MPLRSMSSAARRQRKYRVFVLVFSFKIYFSRTEHKRGRRIPERLDAYPYKT